LLVLASVSLAVPAREARADTFSDYQPSGSFSLPAAGALFDVGPDGRVVALVGSTVYRETASGSRAFAGVGTLAGADMPSFGPAFVRVSPDGQRIAVGNNGGVSGGNFQVGVFTFATLSGTWFDANHFDAAWIDNRYVALSAGSFGSQAFVTALDTTSALPTAPVNPTLVSNVGDASGGIAFDATGNLYTANGFQTTGPIGTGAVYAVTHAAWSAALAGGPPVNFQLQGIPIVELLSGSPLGFDAAGDLLVGGGNSFATVPDDNYFAIVRASAVAAALAGGGMVSTSDPTRVRKLDPDPGAGSVYGVAANRARGEIYAVNFGSQTAYAFKAVPPVVPATPAWATAALAALLLAVGSRRLRALR
jgi:hypothetical protein